MSSERIVMGDAPDKKSKKGIIFILLGLILVIVVLVLFLKPFNKEKVETEQQTAQEVLSEEAVSEPIVAPETPVQEAQSASVVVGSVEHEKEKEAEIVPAEQKKMHLVIKGDYLWNIARIEYNDPFQWSLIYEANKDKIKDPNLIYPNQELIIP